MAVPHGGAVVHPAYPGLGQELRQGGDREANQGADDRAVDADVLEIGADMALELRDQLLLLPRKDLILDEAAKLGAVLFHERGQRRQDLLVDPSTDRGIGVELLAELDDEARQAAAHAARKPGAKLVPQAADVGRERGTVEHLVA